MKKEILKDIFCGAIVAAWAGILTYLLIITSHF